jgi:hypothetical protein
LGLDEDDTSATNIFARLTTQIGRKAVCRCLTLPIRGGGHTKASKVANPVNAAHFQCFTQGFFPGISRFLGISREISFSVFRKNQPGIPRIGFYLKNSQFFSF